MATYILKKENFNDVYSSYNDIKLLDTLTIEHAGDLLNIQSQIKDEISEGISLLTLDGLTNKTKYAAEGLQYCLVIEEGVCVGYGYGFLETKDVFYIDTIGVIKEHRRKKVAMDIKAALTKYSFSIKGVKSVKAITQEENIGAIALNVALGFQLQGIESGIVDEPNTEVF